MADAIHVNQRVRLKGTFKNDGGTLTNPTTVTCRLKNPAGAITTPVPSNPSTGVYQIEHVVDSAGRWAIEFKGSGIVDTTNSMAFYVKPSEVDR